MRAKSLKVACTLLATLMLMSSVLLVADPVQSYASLQGVDPPEADGASIWSNATELEHIGISHPAFRCAGSAGANASAEWILARFQEIGLESRLEGFQFYGWDLSNKPILEVFGSSGSSEGGLTIASFEADQFSVATPSEGANGEIVVLPLPVTYSYAGFASLTFDPEDWSGVDVHDRIVLVGREVRWNPDFEEGLARKLQEGPAALVFYYSQPWASSLQVMFSASSGGRPLSTLGGYLQANHVPLGHIDSDDSELLLAMLGKDNLTAVLRIDSRQGIWTQGNVVATLPGEPGATERVLLTAHYDSVMDGGFCDNAASVAIILEAAAKLSSMREAGTFEPSCSIDFIAFSGEELGLVGSSFYFAQHAGESGNVKALINIDCLGAGTMTRTVTEPYQGLDLDEIVDEVANEVGVSPYIEDGSSDHHSFLYPHDVAMQIQAHWGLSPDVPYNAAGVTSSISLFSTPLSPLDGNSDDQRGWIHTSRDNSSFSASSDWVTQGNLEQQGSVVLALCMELAGTADATDGGATLPSMTSILVIMAIVGVAVLLALVLWRRKGNDS